MANNKIDKKFIIFAIIVSLFFIFSMVNNLMHSPLWGDEWTEFSVSRAALFDSSISLFNEGGTINFKTLHHTIFKMFPLFARCLVTFQPPLYNVLMHFYLMISNSLLWFRLFNVFISLISGVYLYKTIKLLSNKWMSLVGLVLLSTFYQWIYTVQECSEYCLMLLFEFMAIYYFLRLQLDIDNSKPLDYKTLLFFLSSATAAIYSQYGAVFVCVPMIVIFFTQILVGKKAEEIKTVIKTYIFYFVFLAIPLLVTYVRVQFRNNKLTEYTIPIDKSFLTDFFPNIGKMIFYIHGVNLNEILCIVVGIIFTLVMIYIFCTEKSNSAKRNIILTMGISYIIYYILVKKHIYAMVHANQSGGFFSRYAVFFIPIIVLLIIMSLDKLLFSKKNSLKLIGCILSIILVVESVFSYKKILKNWEKTADFKMMEIYIEKKGYEIPTVLLGTSRWCGFRDYLKDYISQTKIYDEIDLELDSFWIYAVDWTKEANETIHKFIEDSPEYKVTKYYDDGRDNLYYFSK